MQNESALHVLEDDYNQQREAMIEHVSKHPSYLKQFNARNFDFDSMGAHVNGIVNLIIVMF